MSSDSTHFGQRFSSAAWLMAQAPPAEVSLVDGFRTVEVASVSDAMEQLYGQRAYMSHDMRPLSATKFAGPAVTVQLKKEEHKEGAAASQGMLDAIDSSPAGSVYVMVLEDGVVVVPIGRAADILKKSQELDDTEHRMIPFIEKFRSIREAVKQFGRI